MPSLPKRGSIVKGFRLRSLTNRGTIQYKNVCRIIPLREAVAKPASIHTLRHSFATHLLEKGRFEVLEHISAYEEAQGFLNDKLEPAFHWVDIYQERNDRFAKATGAFPSFLKARKVHYMSWMKALENPQHLNSDNQGLIKANA